ncbi:MAG: hypothetical protein U5L04_07360 [Trueperaceae bacterium]|nr:hypothetical protein [Trueperaceae bacterium]
MIPLDSPVVLVLVATVGALELFYGYRIIRLLVAAAGVVVGFRTGPDLYTFVFGTVAGDLTTLGFALTGAVLFGLLAYYAFWAAVFLWGMYTGYLFGLSFFRGALFSALLLGASVGIVAALFERVIIALLTALYGGWLISSSLFTLFGYLSGPPGILVPQPRQLPTEEALLLLGTTVALAALGSAVQLWRDFNEERARAPDLS